MGSDSMNFRIGIDVGGTFTDFLLITETGESKVYKTLSTPNDPTIGFFNGLSEMAEDHNLSLNQFIEKVDLIVHGTTVGTNAALTYSGAKTALLTTNGFRDILQMRRGIRPDPYNNQYVMPNPFVPRHLRIGIDERVDVKGEAIKPLIEKDVINAIDYIEKNNVEAIAICFMHSYANDQHEKLAAQLIKERLPGRYITVSSELIPRGGFYDRSSTTVLNSYIGPIIQGYFKKLIEKLAVVQFGGTLLIMQSNGGVATPNATIEKAANTLLSGPASAPVAGGWYLQTHDIKDALTMDMGGTSFDVALLKDGQPLIRTEGEIAEWPISLPIVDIHTIGAGGGSIAWVDDGGLLHVGPKSAGAFPGPACYGFGGEMPTVTDANLVLGYLNPDFFLGGKMKLDLEKAREAIETHVADKLNISIEDAAKGIIDLVDVSMANGIREITIKRGFDPRDFPLVCAGGAGPLHATAIAKELDCTLVMVPKESSIFCAAGMLMSDLRHDYIKVYQGLTNELEEGELVDILDSLELKGMETLSSEGVHKNNIEFQYNLDMKYAGQYYEVSVPFSIKEKHLLTKEYIEHHFHELHNQLFGYNSPEMPVMIVNVNVSAIGRTLKPKIRQTEYAGESPKHALKGNRLIYRGEKEKFISIPVYDGDTLVHGNRVSGPAIIEQKVTTTIVHDSFNVIYDKNDNAILYDKELGEDYVQSFIEANRGVKA